MSEHATTVHHPRKLAHAVLRSGHLKQSVDWWCTVLGARVVHSNAIVTFLTYDDEHHRLALIDMGAADAPPPGTTGLEHLAFTYGGLDELVDTYERLAGEGIEPYWCVNHGMTLSMYYRDPDGIAVELQIDVCSAEDAMAFMDGDDFAANPIGVEYDPAELARQHRAGEAPTALGLYGPGAVPAAP